MSVEVKYNTSKENIIDLLKLNHIKVVKEFYEMESGFLSSRYKIHNSIETSIIIINLIKITHLEIIRQRERNLDYNISLENFWKNLSNINIPADRIISIVNKTGIPKETVRRKIKKLVQENFIKTTNYKEYYWFLSNKRKDDFFNLMNKDIRLISKYLLCITQLLNLNLTQKTIEEEIKSQFSFYFYHFLNSQLLWLKKWQTKIKDIDLIFIAIQALIPTLSFTDRNLAEKKISLNDLHLVLGKTSSKYKISESTISATSISEISGMPRATCIRKLDRLIKLGLLIRETKSKRYYINQFTPDRTKNILKKENVDFSIDIYSDFLSIVITALMRIRK